jgi:hypothetical protein
MRMARDERISALMLTRWVLNSPRFECPRYGYYGYEALAHIGPIARTYPRLCDYRLAHISRCSHTNDLDPLMAPAIQQITLHKRQKSAIFPISSLPDALTLGRGRRSIAKIV